MEIKSPKERTLTIASGVTVLVLLSLALLREQNVPTLFYSITLIWPLGACIELLRNARYVVVDQRRGIVTVHTRSWNYQRRTLFFPLQKFRFIISYVLPGKTPVNLVELINRSGGESLLIASFSNATSQGFMQFMPRPIESSGAALLRKELASQLQLEDKGFVGYRWIGAQIKPHT
jgi:hypothetical protein